MQWPHGGGPWRRPPRAGDSAGWSGPRGAAAGGERGRAGTLPTPQFVPASQARWTARVATLVITDVGNEDQVLVSLLIESERAEQDAMAAGLVGRYKAALYVGRDCRRAASRRRRRCWPRCRACRSGWTHVALPAPTGLRVPQTDAHCSSTPPSWRVCLRRCSSGTRATCSCCRDSMGVELPRRSMPRIWRELRRHLACLQDRAELEVYTVVRHSTRGDVSLPVYRSARGTTSLESFHLQQARLIQVSSKYSPVCKICMPILIGPDYCADASLAVSLLRRSIYSIWCIIQLACNKLIATRGISFYNMQLFANAAFSASFFFLSGLVRKGFIRVYMLAKM